MHAAARPPCHAHPRSSSCAWKGKACVGCKASLCTVCMSSRGDPLRRMPLQRTRHTSAEACRGDRPSQHQDGCAACLPACTCFLTSPSARKRGIGSSEADLQVRCTARTCGAAGAVDGEALTGHLAPPRAFRDSLGAQLALRMKTAHLSTARQLKGTCGGDTSTRRSSFSIKDDSPRPPTILRLLYIQSSSQPTLPSTHSPHSLPSPPPRTL